MKIKCYKGIDNKVLMFGLNPFDFLFALPLLLVVFLVCLFIFDAIGFLPALFAGRSILSLLFVVLYSDKVKNRPRAIHLYLKTYFDIPKQLHIPQTAKTVSDHGQRTTSN